MSYLDFQGIFLKHHIRGLNKFDKYNVRNRSLLWIFKSGCERILVNLKSSQYFVQKVSGHLKAYLDDSVNNL